MQTTLTKSDFKHALTCPTKLFYKKQGYPTLSSDNEYLNLLSEGGFMVGKLAQLKFPNGILISNRLAHHEAVEVTRQYLQNENATLFEAAVYSKNKLVRVDILDKKGKEISLIEVKSKSWDSNNPPAPDKRIKALKEYLEDLTFQTIVLEEAFPDHTIKPYLYLPDKAKTTAIEGLNGMFSLKEITDPVSGRKFTQVSFDGDPGVILEDDIITLLPIDKEVNALKEEVKTQADILISSLRNGPQRIEVPIDTHCRSCEYKTDPAEDQRNGFRECWGALADATQHILELSRIGNFNSKNQITELIENGRASVQDVPVDLVEGKYNNRAFFQITKAEEWLSDSFGEILTEVEYPIHFIDFETSRMAIPYHKGMRPYENVAFQWSCHTIQHAGAEPIHREWINVEDTFPNFAFAQSLMECVGRDGSLMMWSHHENTILKDILEQMEKYGFANPALADWLRKTAKLHDKDSTRLIDMNRITEKHYFHPYMKGRTSIKVTLPSVLQETRSEKTSRWLKEFEPQLSLFGIEEGKLQNPYSLLPKLEFAEQAEKVSDGTGAMRAYQEMLYGQNRGNKAIREEWKTALLRYCKLDTLAMVIIWERWNELLHHKQ